MLLLLLVACEVDPGDGPFALAWADGEDCVETEVPNLTPPDALTVELWLRGDPGAIAAERPFAGWTGVFGLGENVDSSVYFWVGEEPGATTVDSVMDGVLHHVVGSWDGDSVDLFVDGVRLSFADGVPATAPGGVLRIGCDAQAHSYSGLLDEVRISSVVRYEDDFEVESVAFTEDADTLLLYHFDEGTGDTAVDSAQGLDALVAGPEWVPFSFAGAE